jgi:hypothetical protein
MTEWTAKMIKIHGDFLNRELSDNDKEYVEHLLECIINIDTLDKQIVFNDLASCFPKLDYTQIALKLERMNAI